jgi:D-xylose transport system substrate-binding protein
MYDWNAPMLRRGRAGVALVAASVLLAACGGEDSESDTKPAAASGGDAMVDGFAGRLPKYDGDGKVGFSIYNGAVPHWKQADIPGLEKCLDTYAPNVEMVTQDPKGDARLQTSQVQSMFSQGITVLLLTPVAPTPTAILTAAKQNNVPVINYVNPIVDAKEGELVALIGDGPTPIGTAQAEWILEQNYPKGTEIALINGDLATQYAQLMRDAQMAVLQPALDSGDLKLVGDKGSKNWDGADAEKQAAAVLVANPDVKAIIAGADFLATGVINALKAERKIGKVDIIGLDGQKIGTQQMLLGQQKATVMKSSHKEMEVGCAAVVYTLADKPLPKEIFSETWDVDTAPIPFRDTPVEVIERDEVEKAIEWNIVTKEEMCDGLPADVGEPCSGA